MNWTNVRTRGKMYRIVVTVLLYQALAEAGAEDPSRRTTRQVTECCPCPGSFDAGQDMLGGSQLARASGLDDCPCRPRGADSEGASSIFFPSTLRTDRPLMRTFDTKEDSKNLLKPEVALATSMLDTLREATEEEYQNALARDAAKSAADDAVPEESARNVVIIVKPREPDDSEDIVSEASHVQESRCVHPVDSTSLGRMRSSTKPMNILTESLKFSNLKESGALHKKILHQDSNVGASNTEESVIDMSGNSPRFQSRSPMFSGLTPIQTIRANLDEASKSLKNGFNSDKINENGLKTGSGSTFLVSPNFKSRKNVFGGDDLSSVNDNVEALSKGTNDKIDKLFKRTKLPLNVRNLFKLRDVELIPKNIHRKALTKPNLDVPKFTIPTLLNKSKNDKSFSNNCNDESKSGSSLEIVQNGPSVSLLDQENLDRNMKIIKTISEENDLIKTEHKHLDNIPNPSLIQPTTLNTDEEFNNKILQRSDDISENVNIESVNNESELNCFLGDEKVPASTGWNNLKSSATVPDAEIVNDNDFENESPNLNIDRETQDSENSSSNKISTFVPLDVKEVQADLLPQNQNDIDVETEPCESNSKTEKNLPVNALLDRKIMPMSKSASHLSETLSNIRKNVHEKIKLLKKPPVETEFSQLSVLPQNTENCSVSNEDLDGNINDIIKSQHPDDDDDLKTLTTSNADVTSSEDNDTTNNVSMDDLQKMSDTLLDLNSKSQIDENVGKSNIMSEGGNNKLSALDNALSDHTLPKVKLDPVVESSQINDVSSLTNKDVKNTCLKFSENSDTLDNEGNKFESEGLNIEPIEMDTGASDTVMNTLPSIFDSLNSNLKLRTPLLDDIIVQPTSDPLHLLGKPIANVLHLNTNLPTLDELRQRLANIFNTNDRSAEEDSSSLQNDSDYNSLEAMASEASTSNFQRKIPTIKSINEDIFENKPFTSSLKDRLSSPGSLNSFRSKVPAPNNLELRPVRLESGKSIFPIESNRKTVARKTKPNSLIINNPLQTMPTIEDLRNTLLSKSNNALGSSKRPDSHLLTKSLRSDDVEDIADTIRLNTEKTIKGLQRKIQSSVKKAKSNNPLGDAIANPNELLDDMNDKLKAIHYDLNDRLSSIHENILDSSRLNSITDHFRAPENRNVMTNLRQNKAKSTPARLRTAASSITAQKVDPNSPLRITDIEKNSKIYWNKLRDEQFRGSATPTRNELLMPSVSHFQNTHPLRINPTPHQFLSERTPSQDLRKKPPTLDYMNKPIFRTPLSSLNQDKVTISFGTTTARPISLSRPVFSARDPVAQPQTERRSSSLNTNNRLAKDKKPLSLNHRINTFADSNLSPNQISSLRNTPPTTSFNDDFDKDIDNFSIEQNSIKPNLRPPILRKITKSKPLMTHGFDRSKSDSDLDVNLEQPGFKGSGFNVHSPKPKATENSFMSKLRGAINSKKSEMASKSVEDASTEMYRAPSENTIKIIEEPLKENVSYRCRMVCTKEYT